MENLKTPKDAKRLIQNVKDNIKKITEYSEVDTDNLPIDKIQKMLDNVESLYLNISDVLNNIETFISSVIQDQNTKDILEETNILKSVAINEYKQTKRLLQLSFNLRKTNVKLENSLGLQFGIFSAVLSILSFVLNNSKLLAYEKIDFKNVLLINFSHILACAVMFYFAMWFIKPYKHNKGRVWTLTLIIIAICALIYLIAKNIITL